MKKVIEEHPINVMMIKEDDETNDERRERKIIIKNQWLPAYRIEYAV